MADKLGCRSRIRRLARWITPLALAAFAAASSQMASAQSFPSKPLRIVVPFGAGSSTDLIARIVGQPLSVALGQPVIVENKPGGDGAVAALDVKRAAPDGHTLLLTTNSPLSVVPHLHKQPPYDAVADFTGISHIGYYTFLVVVNPAVPARTMAELIAHAKANKGKLNYATGNTGSIVSTALVQTLAGIEMSHVPYKTEPAAMPDLLAGQVHVTIASYSPLAGPLREGKLRAIAVMLPERSANLPDVPSFTEVGFKDFPVVPWAGLVGPAKIPAAVVERLNKEVVTILARADVGKQLTDQAIAVKSSTAEELNALIKQRLESWGKVMKSAGLHPQ